MNSDFLNCIVFSARWLLIHQIDLLANSGALVQLTVFVGLIENYYNCYYFLTSHDIDRTKEVDSALAYFLRRYRIDTVYAFLKNFQLEVENINNKEYRSPAASRHRARGSRPATTRNRRVARLHPPRQKTADGVTIFPRGRTQSGHTRKHRIVRT